MSRFRGLLNLRKLSRSFINIFAKILVKLLVLITFKQITPDAFNILVYLKRGFLIFIVYNIQSIMKIYNIKQKPSIIKYRNIKHFYNHSFLWNLWANFWEIAVKQLRKKYFFIFLWQRYGRCNQEHFRNKEICKAIMMRTCLLNKFRKDISKENLKAYKKQQSCCVKLPKIEKKKFYY